jgi:hypothetical protein
MVRVRISAGHAQLRIRVLGWYAPMTVPRGTYFHAAFGGAAFLADSPPLGPTQRFISGSSYWDPLGEGAGVAPHASGVLYSAAVRAPRHTGLLCLSGVERSTPCVGTLVPAGRSAVTSLPVGIDYFGFSRTRLRGTEAAVRFVVQGYFAAA